jgi:hypothetical protein
VMSLSFEFHHTSRRTSIYALGSQLLPRFKFTKLLFYQSGMMTGVRLGFCLHRLDWLGDPHRGFRTCYRFSGARSHRRDITRYGCQAKSLSDRLWGSQRRLSNRLGPTAFAASRRIFWGDARAAVWKWILCPTAPSDREVSCEATFGWIGAGLVRRCDHGTTLPLRADEPLSRARSMPKPHQMLQDARTCQQGLELPYRADVLNSTNQRVAVPLLAASRAPS